MKNLILSIIYFLLVCNAWSQNRQVTQLNLEQLASTSPASPGFMAFDNNGMQIKGTPYLFDEWKIGRVRLEGEKFFTGEIGILLDLQDDRIYVQLEDDFTAEFSVDKVDALEIYNEQDTALFETYDLFAYYGIGPKRLRFYEILHKGMYTVLHLQKKYLRKEEYIEKVGIVERPNEFRSLHSYWFNNGKSIKKIKKKTSSIKSAVTSREARKVNRIIKRNNLKIKKDKDFGTFFRLLEEEKSR